MALGMDLTLTPDEARVLGALMEKEMTTPDYYPLSLNALTNACNQKSNRDPVVSFDDAIVRSVVEDLREKRLAEVLTGDRVLKYGHRVYEALNLGKRELSLLCVLLLRGPQTVGELKERTHRMHEFDGLESVEQCLERLASHEPGPLVMKLGRQPGMRESRFAHLLCGAEGFESESRAEGGGSGSPRMDAGFAPGDERLQRLEAELEAVKSRLGQLQQEWADFRKQFE